MAPRGPCQRCANLGERCSQHNGTNRGTHWILSEETRKRQRAAKQKPESKQKVSEVHTMLRQDPEHRSARISAMTGVLKSEETKQKMSVSKAQQWQDSEYAYKVLSAGGSRPNRAEQKLLDIIFPAFQYVGDGRLTVVGKCPDFWNGDTKLIEMYGDYWHRGQDPQDRINLFKTVGYDCLVIWEHELKDPDTVIARVSDFTGGS